MPTIYFDLDGTLIDVRKRHYAAYAKATREFALTPVHEHDYWERRLEGANNADLADVSDGDRETFIRRWVELAESREYLRLDTLVSGARAALTCLRTTHGLVLVTLRRDRAALDEQLDDLALTKFFSAVHCHADVPQARDKAELLHLRGESVDRWSSVVGDTEADIEAARTLGLRSICVLTGLRGRRFLAEHKPNAIITSVAHLTGELAQRPAAIFG